MTSNLKKTNIDQLIKSDNLNDSIIELDNYICALCEWGDNIPALSYPQVVFYFNQELEREVNNGGFSQYFENSSGRYANDTINMLREVGADRTAKILEDAIAFFPNKKVPTDEDLKMDAYNQIKDEANKGWDILDSQFFKYEDDLNQLNMEYVKSHKDYF